ncbi:MAG: transglutaminase domain-containing protein [Burkholderiales bacterium]|nr:transglutaminase domain-containing protein [Burkholderiales bacterium]
MLPFATESCYRNVPEARIVEHLVFHGWRRAARRADPEAARRVVVEALARWRALGLPAARDGDGNWRYDPAEVFLCKRWSGRTQGDPFWREHHVAIERARVLSFHPADGPREAPPSMSALPPRRFTVALRRRFHPAYLAAPARLRLPLPYADDALGDLEVTLEPVDAAGEWRTAPGCAELRLAETPDRPVTLAVRVSFVAHAYSPPREVVPLLAAERERYLRHAEELIQVTPSLAALAADLCRGVVRARERVRRFLDYLLDGFTAGPFPYEWLDARAPLDLPREGGWFDCRLGSALVAALCRVSGIPARRVSGYLLYPECAGYHWWLEAWFDDVGWVPIDTWAADLSANGADARWRGVFFGDLDYRMKSEVLPRVFNRSLGVRLPPVWRILEREVDDGATEIAVVDPVENREVWADTVRIEMGAALDG